MSLPEQDTIKKGRMNEILPVLEFEVSNNKEYKVEVIQNSTVYTKKVDKHLLGLYYLVVWKGYPEEENTWEPTSAVMCLWKIVSTFHKDYSEKLIVTSVSLDSTPLMASQQSSSIQNGNNDV